MRFVFQLLSLAPRLYRVLSFIALSILRFFRQRRGKYHWFDRIDDHIWIGGAPLQYCNDIAYLRQKGITAIINIAPEIPHYDVSYFQEKNNFLSFQVIDRTPPTLTQLQTAVSWIAERVAKNKIILIHCALGKGRSVCVAMAWYMYSQHLSVAEALAFIQKQRPQAQPDHEQMRRIDDFAEQLKRGTITPAVYRFPDQKS